MAETRLADVVDRQPAMNGRSTVAIRCPFCGCVTEARVWSLAGSGKRCECGVLLGSSRGTVVAIQGKDGER